MRRPEPRILLGCWHSTKYRLWNARWQARNLFRCCKRGAEDGRGFWNGAEPVEVAGEGEASGRASRVLKARCGLLWAAGGHADKLPGGQKGARRGGHGGGLEDD